jgi:glycosyltransferase involved in cell wall biosynthesis
VDKGFRVPGLTVGILALNESARIAQCVASAAFAEKVIVIDSGSEDDTVALAQAGGAEVHCYDNWQGFATQRNRLLTHVTTEYIFFLDADEVIPEPLAHEIATVVASGRNEVWEIFWTQVAYGRTLTRMRSTGGIKRLFKRSSLLLYEGVVHEAPIMRHADIPVRRFQTPLLHYSRETVYDSLKKLAQYAQLGALKRAEQGRRGGILRGAASALAMFIKLYVFRRAFLCGPQGFLFCFFIALECFFRYVALKYDFGNERSTTVAMAKR